VLIISKVRDPPTPDTETDDASFPNQNVGNQNQCMARQGMLDSPFGLFLQCKLSNGNLERHDKDNENCNLHQWDVVDF